MCHSVDGCRDIKTSWALNAAAVLASLVAIFTPAIGADLGVNCCADLQEVLQNTTGKGNIKVTLTNANGGPANIPQVTFGKGSYLLDLQQLTFVTTVTPGTPFAVSGPRVAVVDTSSFTHEPRTIRSVVNGVGNAVSGALDDAHSCGAADDATAVENPDQCTDRSVWAVALGGYADIDGTRSAFSGEQTLVGGLGGARFDAAPGITFGLFGGYAQTDFQTEFAAEQVETSYGIAGAFARLRSGQGFADVSVTGLWSDSDRRRDIASNIAGINGFETATASTNGWTVSPALTFGLRLPVSGDTIFVPAVKVRGTFGHAGGFSETGTSANFSAGARDVADMDARLELGVHKSFAAAGLNGLVRATAGVSYFGAFADDTINGTLLGQSVRFSSGLPDTEFGGFVSLGFELPLSASASLFGDTEMHLTDRAQEISGFGGVKVKF